MKGTLRDAVLVVFGIIGLALAGHAMSVHGGLENAVDHLGNEFLTPAPGLMATGTGFGILLLGSWMAGRVASVCRLPKITGYLLFGIIIGPSTAPVIIREEQLDYLKLVNDLAIALIALTAGSEIQIDFVRRALKTIVSVMVFQIVGILLLVTAAAWLLLSIIGIEGIETGAQRLWVALVLATIATASSPAVVIAIITDLRARSTMAQVALAVTVSKDLVLVILFAVIITLAGAALAGGGDQPPPDEVAVGIESAAPDHGGHAHGAEGGHAVEDGDVTQRLAIELGGSILAGIIAGLFMSLYLHRLHAHLAIFVVFSCFGIALLSEVLHLEPLIVALIAGMLMKNLWRQQSEVLFDTVEELSLPVYCVFFSVAGCKADVGSLVQLGHWALLLGLVRAGTIWGSARVGARFAGLDRATSRGLWTAFVSQAGVSLVLATRVRDTFAEEAFAAGIYNLLLASIVLNEIVGPMLFKIGLTRVGEGSPGEGEEPPDSGGEEMEIG